MPDSSSTIRMLCMVLASINVVSAVSTKGKYRGLPPAELSVFSGRAGFRSGFGFGCQWQLHDEPRSYGLVFFHPNRTMMVFDYPTHNRQPQAGAAALGRKIRQEELFFQLWGDSGTSVRHDNFDGILALDQRRGDGDLAHQALRRCLSGVVHQVGQGTP